MGSKRNVNMSENTDVVKVLSDEPSITDTNNQEQPVTAVEGETSAEGEVAEAPKKVAKPAHQRSQRYQAVRAQVDKTKAYDAFAAIELIKKLSYTKFAGTLTADMVVKEEGIQISVSFPHSTGRTLRVAIANEAVIKQIEAGQLDFDVLVTEPRFMGQLAKFAKVLGPKGLMPNPKNGTVTSNPELKKQQLEGGQVTIKAEKKAPLMHVSIGKTSMDTKDLLDNLNALLGALRGKVLKLNLSATMSPAVRVGIEQ